MLRLNKYLHKSKFFLLFLLALVIFLFAPLLTSTIVNSSETNITQNINDSPNNLLKQGIKYYQAEQFLTAIELWEKADLGFAIQNNHLAEAFTLSNLSLAYQKLGMWEKAENAIAKSFNRLKNFPNQKDYNYQAILAKAENTQGKLLWSRGKLQEALNFWQNSALHYVQADDLQGIVIAKINQAKALQGLGLTRQAQEILEEVNNYLQKEQNSELKATGLRNLGNAWRQIGDFLTSQEMLQKSLEITQTNHIDTPTVNLAV